tara:strand:+ start:2140 stop:2379 length:240 start_codon:yes stop_codon:yes gene_type:complete
LKKISDEGVPQQFFANSKPSNKNQYQSNSTAGFNGGIGGKSLPYGLTATESSINYQVNDEKRQGNNIENPNDNDSSEQY